MRESKLESSKKSPFCEIVSSFLFRGKFEDFSSCYRKFKRKSTIEVTDARIKGLLDSKNWLRPALRRQSNPDSELIEIGSILEIEVDVVEKWKDAHTFQSIGAKGVVMRRGNHGTEDFRVGTVDYEATSNDAFILRGNIVTSFLDRWEVIDADVTLFGKGGYTMLKEVDTIRAPEIENVTRYAESSEDWNPIHRNPYFAILANLPHATVHNMWLATNGRRVLHKVAGSPEFVASYNCSFESVVRHGEKLYTQVTHIGNKGGRKIVAIETLNENKQVVLKGRAEIDLPRTAYLFTGQGSAQQGMGMDLYNSSKTARAVWDAADKHLFQMYGFSIMDIVKNNPQSLTVHFGGRQGAKLRKNFEDLGIISPYDGEDSYTFTNAAGLLFSTQFTQPAQVLMEKASYEDMRANGLIPNDAFIAGHSLGEYAAISCVGQLMSTESLVEVTFLRGMTMQKAVPRDPKTGKSDFAMVAVKPAAVGSHVNQEKLIEIVSKIEKFLPSYEFLQLVNFNIKDKQYVAAGKIYSLVVLTKVLNALASTSSDTVKFDKLIEEKMKEAFEEQRLGTLTLERTKATVPLGGIDVPFHSTILFDKVDAFRKLLESKITKVPLPYFSDICILSQSKINLIYIGGCCICI
jgi:malonyl CoA-acyl carrier protein transacylase/acyl dehydratase